MVASREYAIPGDLDPFRLPRALRALAFAGKGHDMDDSASFPRVTADVFRSGSEISKVFLDRRRSILGQIGLYFFGTGVAPETRRAHAKGLMNALDNDGSIESWRRVHNMPAALKPLTERLGHPGGPERSL